MGRRGGGEVGGFGGRLSPLLDLSPCWGLGFGKDWTRQVDHGWGWQKRLGESRAYFEDVPMFCFDSRRFVFHAQRAEVLEMSLEVRVIARWCTGVPCRGLSIPSSSPDLRK
jgi:hypothetical protein